MASMPWPRQLSGDEEDGQGGAHLGAAGHSGHGASMWSMPRGEAEEMTFSSASHVPFK
jgi:hypothetical protein